MKSIRKIIRRKPEAIRVSAGVVAATVVLAGGSAYSVNAENQEIETVLNSIKTVQRDVGKKESVYFFTDPSGQVTKTIVSDHLVNSQDSSVIKDRTILKDIENVKGDETYEGSGEDIRWQADGADIFYQGTCTEQTPVTMKITYFLDEQERPADEMAGASGKVRIRFDYTNNTSYTGTIDGKEETVCVPLAAVTGVMLNDHFTNVRATNGRVTKNDRGYLVMGYVMPGLKESLEAGEGEFSNASDQLEKGSSELAEGIETLGRSLGTFQSGMNSLNTGVTDYTQGTSGLENGLSQLEDGTGVLQGGIGQIQQGAYALCAGASELTGNNETLVVGANQLTEGTNQIVTGVDALQEGAQKLKSGMMMLNEEAIRKMTGRSTGRLQSCRRRKPVCHFRIFIWKNMRCGFIMGISIMFPK